MAYTYSSYLVDTSTPYIHIIYRVVGDVLDSRMVVGPGCVLSSLGMFGNGATMEAFRESEVFWWVLLMILSQAFKNILLGGCRGELIINRSVVSFLDISANPVTMEAFME